MFIQKLIKKAWVGDSILNKVKLNKWKSHKHPKYTLEERQHIQ